MNKIKRIGMVGVAMIACSVVCSTVAFGQTSGLQPTTTSATPAVTATDPLALTQMAINNIDTNVDYFTSAKLEIRLGAVSQGITGSTFNSVLGGSYNLTPNFGIGGDIRNGGQTGSGMQSAHVFGEMRHTMGNVEFTGYGGGGWRWDGETFEGILGGRVSYIPAPLGAQQWFTWAGPEASMTAKDLKSAPVVQILAGFGYAFK